MDGWIQYLADHHPDALAYAKRHRFSARQTADLSALLNIARENGEIPPHEVVAHSKVDNGSFGSVFKATYKGKTVIVKRIDQAGDSHPLREIVGDIYFELTAAVHLRHPCIVQFEGFLSNFPKEGSNGKVELGFVFEICENGSLHATIFEKRQLRKWESRLLVACQVASGMTYIHSENYIHRDLNSQNVVLTKSMEAKICDFGAARKIGPSGSFTPTMIEGSPSTMSPEQLLGGPLTLRSDVWQMGVFLWEIFALRHPWVNVCDINDHLALTDLIVRRGLRLPPLEQKELPAAVHRLIAGVIHKSFQTKPESRPEMSEVHRCLLEAQNISSPQHDLKSVAVMPSMAKSPISNNIKQPAAAQDDKQRIRMGSEIEYFSSSYNEWIPGKVLGFNQDGSLQLDIKSEASLGQIRLRPSAQESMKDLPSAAPSDVTSVEVAKEILDSKESSDKALILSQPGENIAGNNESIAKQDDTARPLPSQNSCNLTETRCENDKGELYSGENETLSLPSNHVASKSEISKPTENSQREVSAIIRPGEKVEYYSSSYGEWIEAVVLAVNFDRTLNLDVKTEADPQYVRRRRKAEVQVITQAMGDARLTPSGPSAVQNRLQDAKAVQRNPLSLSQPEMQALKKEDVVRSTTAPPMKRKTTAKIPNEAIASNGSSTPRSVMGSLTPRGSMSTAANVQGTPAQLGSIAFHQQMPTPQQTQSYAQYPQSQFSSPYGQQLQNPMVNYGVPFQNSSYGAQFYGTPQY